MIEKITDALNANGLRAETEDNKVLVWIDNVLSVQASENKTYIWNDSKVESLSSMKRRKLNYLIAKLQGRLEYEAVMRW